MVTSLENGMAEFIAWIFRLIFSVGMEVRNSDLSHSNFIESRCPDYGILASSLEIEKAHLEDDHTKIWVRTSKGVLVALPKETATDALKIYESWEMKQFLKAYEIVCGKESKPPFLDLIPYIKSESRRECIRKGNNPKNPRAEEECYEGTNAQKK